MLEVKKFLFFVKEWQYLVLQIHQGALNKLMKVLKQLWKQLHLNKFNIKITVHFKLEFSKFNWFFDWVLTSANYQVVIGFIQVALINFIFQKFKGFKLQIQQVNTQWRYNKKINFEKKSLKRKTTFHWFFKSHNFNNT